MVRQLKDRHLILSSVAGMEEGGREGREERKEEGGEGRKGGEEGGRTYLPTASQNTLGEESSDSTRRGGREGGRGDGSVEESRAVREVSIGCDEGSPVGIGSGNDVHPLLGKG